jgi:hypothetical protein
MATVVFFAFGSRPGLSAHEALEVAELLSRQRDLASVRLAGKIRAQAKRDPDQGETSEDVAVDADEAAVLIALLDEPRWPDDRPAFTHLREELAGAFVGLV